MHILVELLNLVVSCYFVVWKNGNISNNYFRS